MKRLGDQVTYLGHDLRPGAVASLKPNAAKLNTPAKDPRRQAPEPPRERP